MLGRIHWFGICFEMIVVLLLIGCWMYFDMMILFFVGYFEFVLLLLAFLILYNKFVNRLIIILLCVNYLILNLYCSIHHKVFQLQKASLVQCCHYFMSLRYCLIKDYYWIQKRLNYLCLVKANYYNLFFNLKIQIRILLFRLYQSDDFFKIIDAL